MTTSDYIINALFVLVVLRQARERRLDLRALLGPLAAVVFVATQYIHTIPTSGNDLVLVALLASVGLTSGFVCGLSTHVRLGDDGAALARVGRLAGTLLVAGILARLVFALAVSHGEGPAIRSFSIAHHLGAAAWPVALVSMAICEVAARLVVVQLRGRRLEAQAPALAAVA
jgi:hypothetical protein